MVENAPIFICSHCVNHYLHTLDQASLPKKEAGPCSFCNNSYSDASRIVEHQGARICNVCLNVCLEIVADDPKAAS